MSDLDDDDLIRKAIELRLSEQYAPMLARLPPNWITDLAAKGWTDKFPVKWPNVDFDRDVQTYLEITFHPTGSNHPEGGPRSREERTGHSLIGVRVPAASGDDIAGKLVKVIKTAYPYAASLPAEDLEVRIEGVDARPGFTTNGKWYRPVHINWLVSRRPQ